MKLRKTEIVNIGLRTEERREREKESVCMCMCVSEREKDTFLLLPNILPEYDIYGNIEVK